MCFVCVCERERAELGEKGAAEGLVSVKLSSSWMSDWPRFRPKVEYRQARRKAKVEEEEEEDEDVE